MKQSTVPVQNLPKNIIQYRYRYGKLFRLKDFAEKNEQNLGVITKVIRKIIIPAFLCLSID
jgi:hypothetical protein